MGGRLLKVFHSIILLHIVSKRLEIVAMFQSLTISIPQSLITGSMQSSLLLADLLMGTFLKAVVILLLIIP